MRGRIFLIWSFLVLICLCLKNPILQWLSPVNTVKYSKIDKSIGGTGGTSKPKIIDFKGFFFF
jgi:hypothetical protein